MINSRKLEHLCVEARMKCGLLMSECEKEGIEILITCTYRDHEEQNRLFAMGRTTKGVRVTNARGGESKHNCVDLKGQPASKAFDFVPMVGGKCMWNDDETINKVGALAQKVGLRWAGAWSGKFKEKLHCEV